MLGFIRKLICKFKNRLFPPKGPYIPPNILDNASTSGDMREYYAAQLGTFGQLDKNADFRYQRFDDVLTSTGRLKDIRKMLCVGCRNAFELNHFEALGVGEVSGIDLQSVDPRIQIMDMQKMSFADDTFDALYAGDSLEHALDIKTAAREFTRVTKPGALVMLSLPVNYETDSIDRWDCKNADGILNLFEDDLADVLYREEVQDENTGGATIWLMFQTARS